MYYCPECKKKFRQYRRRCPVCNGPCYRSDNQTILLIVAIGGLFLLLVGLIILLFASGSTGNTPDDSEASSSVNSSVISSVPDPSDTQNTTAPTDTTAPPTSTPPTTVPPTTSPNVSGIGMYTREELEAMDTTYNTSGFGAGRASNHARPSYPVSEQKKYEQYGGLFIGPDDSNVYLTFDCGYEYYAKDEHGNEYPVTGLILDVLKEKNAKAVFFVTMDYVKMSPNLVQRMIDEGHIVGNHTVYHPVMPSKSIDRMEREVMDLHNYVLENYDYTMTLFRPPTGAYSIQSLAVVQNLGYKSVLWSFQHYDYDPANQPSLDTAFKVITENSHNGCIYLLHAVSEANAKVLGDVIDNLRNEQNYNIGLLC